MFALAAELRFKILSFRCLSLQLRVHSCSGKRSGWGAELVEFKALNAPGPLVFSSFWWFSRTLSRTRSCNRSGLADALEPSVLMLESSAFLWVSLWRDPPSRVAGLDAHTPICRAQLGSCSWWRLLALERQPGDPNRRVKIVRKAMLVANRLSSGEVRHGEAAPHPPPTPSPVSAKDSVPTAVQCGDMRRSSSDQSGNRNANNSPRLRVVRRVQLLPRRRTVLVAERPALRRRTVRSRATTRSASAVSTEDPAKNRKVMVFVEPSPFSHVSGMRNRFLGLIESLHQEGDDVRP